MLFLIDGFFHASFLLKILLPACVIFRPNNYLKCLTAVSFAGILVAPSLLTSYHPASLHFFAILLFSVLLGVGWSPCAPDTTKKPLIFFVAAVAVTYAFPGQMSVLLADHANFFFTEELKSGLISSRYQGGSQDPNKWSLVAILFLYQLVRLRILTLGASITLCLVFMLITLSLSAAVLTAVLILFWLPLSNAPKYAFWGIAIAIATYLSLADILLAPLMDLEASLKSILGREGLGQEHGRLRLAAAAKWHVIQADFVEQLFGTGLSAMNSWYTPMPGRNAHSTFLTVLICLGLWGAVFLSFILIATYRQDSAGAALLLVVFALEDFFFSPGLFYVWAMSFIPLRPTSHLNFRDSQIKHA